MSDVILWPVPSDSNLHDVRLRDPSATSGGFPPQFSGLRYWLGSMIELCLVAIADGDSGPQWRIRKGGVDYVVYLVDTTDRNASQVRIKTPAGIKSVRLKT